MSCTTFNKEIKTSAENMDTIYNDSWFCNFRYHKLEDVDIISQESFSFYGFTPQSWKRLRDCLVESLALFLRNGQFQLSWLP